MRTKIVVRAVLNNVVQRRLMTGDESTEAETESCVSSEPDLEALVGSVLDEDDKPYPQCPSTAAPSSSTTSPAGSTTPPPGCLGRPPSDEFRRNAHFDGTCKRCCFFPKGRCTNGNDCEFCHFEHAKRPRKKKNKKTTQESSARSGRAPSKGLIEPPPGLMGATFVGSMRADAVPFDPFFAGPPGQLTAPAIEPPLRLEPASLASGPAPPPAGPPGWAQILHTEQCHPPIAEHLQQPLLDHAPFEQGNGQPVAQQMLFQMGSPLFDQVPLAPCPAQPAAEPSLWARNSLHSVDQSELQPAQGPAPGPAPPPAECPIWGTTVDLSSVLLSLKSQLGS